ncbi:MAG: hypothetical protein ABSG67_00720, partial [Thermoguttaceae bacterium]
MWITKSYIVKLLVWLAAALMPADVLIAGPCMCGGSTSDVQVNAQNTHQGMTCCCHPGAICQCCHRAKKTQQSACCKNRAPQFNSTQSAVSTACNCPGGKTPMPQNTLPNSSAKQLINHAYACLAPASTAILPPDALHSIVKCPSMP